MTLTPKEPEYDCGRKARIEYWEYAQAVIGDSELDYPTMYGRFAENDWACIKLDEALVLKALRARRLPREVGSMLLQGPYIQLQVHHHQVSANLMTYYARAIVMAQMLKAGMLLMSRNAVSMAYSSGVFPESP